ncbi:MAG: type II toxin-antitoxin system PemK/MazF family toxin [Chitinophagaceae bacterium]
MRQFEVWLANLEPAIGTEPGKTRPVVIVQTDLLNGIHPSTLICPVSTNVNKQAELLRVHLKKGMLDHASDILVDQLRAIDNRRLIKRLGKIPAAQAEKLRSNMRVLLDL